MVPRVSVANDRWPVDPTLTGCASAKYDDTAAALEALHVCEAGVIVGQRRRVAASR